MDEEKKGFVIKDKRVFDESGKAREESADAKKEPEKTTSAEEPGSKPERDNRNEGYLPEANFASFIISLSTTALFHFGDFPDPETNTAAKNLPAAKQLIDTISMLKDKTEGNLEDDEKNLIDGVLYELRMRYIKETC